MFFFFSKLLSSEHFLSPGPGAETQHHPADVRRESRRGRGAAAGPGGRQEHVQDTNR